MTQPFPQLPPLPQLLPRSQAEWGQLVNVFQNWQAALQPVYGQTQAEIAAGITPVNAAYAPGDVRRYGADPAGENDSTTALADAIASNSVVDIPPGTYHVTSVTVRSSCWLRGWGYGRTQIYAGDATSDVFILTGSSIQVSDLAILPSVTRTAGRYFSCTSTSSIVTLRNLYLLGWYTGIDLEGSNYTLDNVQLTNGVPSAGNGVVIGTAGTVGTLSDIALLNVRVVNPPSSKPNAAVAINACGDVLLLGCNLQQCNFALEVTPGVSKVVASLWASNTKFDTSGTMGVKLQPQASSGAIIRTRFESCWFSSAGSYGLLIDTSASGGTIDGTDIISPHVLLNGSHGISIAGTGTLNTKVALGQFAGNSGCGVLVNAGVTNFAVRGNRIGPCGAVAANTNDAVAVLSGASNYYIIAENDTSGNTGGGIVDNGSGANKYVINNL